MEGDEASHDLDGVGALADVQGGDQGLEDAGHLALEYLEAEAVVGLEGLAADRPSLRAR